MVWYACLMQQLQIRTSGIDAVYYLAKDLDRAVAFYRDVLGLPVASTFPNGVEFVLSDGSAFGVSHMPGAWYPCGGAMFAVDDVAAAVERFRARGLEIYTHGVLEAPSCSVAWCADTEGNNFTVHKRK